MKKILFIVGSLRKGSFNKQLAEAAKEVIGDKAEVTFLNYEDIPYMNQDIEFPAPASIQRIRDEAMAADGIWIFTPEYNGQIPGVLKNVLDWLSRPLKENDFAGPSAVGGKLVTVSGAGGRSATAFVRQRLDELLVFIRMNLLKEHETGVTLPPDAFQTGIYKVNDEVREKLTLQAKDLLAAIDNK